ncbi:hypothetical protein BUALT_Bualt02G0205200 [Buddleja alternifolia]|uniref:Uncharacterized protein n=1 Tax=Buddleja alternifolia TaxID=168488 RepID=A0AAV6Y635_9LAMI|nr:hypothetical protein BUALT_Bualt02G0205200 [Buddleja alternifolia]
MNYLRPDIKRGNFSSEEEEQIIKLHQELGNKWSVIAARLPGRTDNEIKNVWHTHLKKKLNKKSQPEPETQIHTTESSDSDQRVDKNSEPNSPLHSSRSEASSLTTAADAGGADAFTPSDSFQNSVEMDERFWSEVLSGEDSGATSDFSPGNSDSQLQFSNSIGSDLNTEGGMDFWYNLFYSAEELIHLPDF